MHKDNVVQLNSLITSGYTKKVNITFTPRRVSTLERFFIMWYKLMMSFFKDFLCRTQKQISKGYFSELLFKGVLLLTQ